MLDGPGEHPDLACTAEACWHEYATPGSTRRIAANALSDSPTSTVRPVRARCTVNSLPSTTGSGENLSLCTDPVGLAAKVAARTVFISGTGPHVYTAAPGSAAATSVPISVGPSSSSGRMVTRPLEYSSISFRNGIAARVRPR